MYRWSNTLDVSRPGDYGAYPSIREPSSIRAGEDDEDETETQSQLRPADDPETGPAPAPAALPGELDESSASPSQASAAAPAPGPPASPAPASPAPRDEHATRGAQPADTLSSRASGLAMSLRNLPKVDYRKYF
ncbi:cyclin-dependent kinase inhibitor 1C-like [Plutella xylostella]|uniref:cyclin-dependent kinase inhibitor 1C-like n=1 Tax=Plutella xylostella TaxID=51655 RepID=UPI002032B48C|nr:cyclin-dependent kinase inhibitor 1C-like [Plutella xylostella]